MTEIPEDFNIFGSMDVEEIKSNPNWVEEGFYEAIVQSAKIIHSDNQDQWYLVIMYVITSDGKYHNKPVSEYLKLYPHMTPNVYAELTDTEQAKVDKDNTLLKRRLCGDSSNRKRRGLGVDEKKLREFKPDDIVNVEVNLAVRNWGETGENVSIRYADMIIA